MSTPTSTSTTSSISSTAGRTQAAAPIPTDVQTLPFAKAINAGLRAALGGDDKVLLMGEDIGPLGGVFRVTDGLQASFGADRVVDTPLAESGILGTAIGLALRGYRPVCEIQFDGFIFPAFDQITTQLAKMHYRSRGRLTVPVVVRVPYGGGIGAVEHHSESPEVLFAHTPGLRVVSPGSPQDAYTMIQEAIASPDPVLFFEPKGRYWEKGAVDLSAGPYGRRAAEQQGADAAQQGAADEQSAGGQGDADEQPVRESITVHEPITVAEANGFATLNTAVVARPGTDLTLVAYGPTVATALKVAEAAASEGTSIEVVDLRSISPLDTDTVVESVRKTHRCVVVHEAPTFLGTGAEIAATVTERCFYDLEAPVLRVGGFHTPYPVAKIEHEYLPSLDRVLDAVDRSLAF
jgi:2-oxoisovalerate dehydrogenase E1 component beta subunit